MVESSGARASVESAAFCLERQELERLLQTYDRQGPRYTSYPPATEFKPWTAQDYLMALQACPSAGEAEPTSLPISLYLHIPFCTSPCFYCGCNKIITKNRSAVREYLDHLRKEMALVRLQMNVYKRPVTQLHWGGGTPTFLDDAEMTELMHHTATYFNLTHQDDRDYSIEVDPRSVDAGRIDLLRGLGFNRISLGVQDFDPAVQKAINREQPVALVEELTAAIRTRGFRSLNFDLIYGLPRQTLASVEHTLEQVIRLSPDRVSYYNYAHLPERFAAQKAIQDSDLPTADEKLAILSLIISRLSAAGYEYIGMDHFVKADDPLAIAKREGKLCRNFQGYSVHKADDLIGLGVSSISEVAGTFAQNHVGLDAYYQALEANQLPVCKGLVTSDEDRMRQQLIQQLTCYRRLDMAAFEKKYGIDFEAHFAQAMPLIQQYEDDGLLKRSGQVLEVTRKGCLLLRPICMAFDAYLPGRSLVAGMGVVELQSPRFSRVI